MKSSLSTKTPLKDKTQEKHHSIDKVWDELLTTPESEAFLTMMIAHVRKEEAEGKLIEGGWDEI